VPLLERSLTLNRSRESRIDVSNPAPDAEASSSSSAVESVDEALCERCECKRCKAGKPQAARGWKKKRESPLDVVIQDLPRRNLVDFLATHWETLKDDGLYTDSSMQVIGWDAGRRTSTCPSITPSSDPPTPANRR
jgi:hypothetical protein